MNSELYDKKYNIPDEIIKDIKIAKSNNPNHDGIKRANFIINNRSLTYQAIKRILHDMDNIDDKIKYSLMGGDKMKSFIKSKLDSDRELIKNEKKNSSDHKTNTMAGLNLLKQSINPDLLNESEKNNNGSALCIIVNNEKKILLLKRRKDSDWGGGKWSLVGGGIDDNETPKQACIREIKEETNIDIEEDNIYEILSLKRKNSEPEIVFFTQFSNDSNIKLDGENDDWGFFSVSEIKEKDTVPQLIEYLKLAFKKYK